MTVFSRRKKIIIPPKTNKRINVGFPFDIAFGIIPNNAAVSKVPVA